MSDITINDLIQKANSVIKTENNSSITGSVGCALITDKGNIYTGFCIETESETSICAEQSAITQMLKMGESKIIKIVTTWKDEKGDFYIISPCGRCRQVIFDANKQNLNSDVILNINNTVKLSELLPHNNEYNKV
jgi:cytidine deaminase